MTELLGRDGGRLCLLGAGNANDVDLEALASRYDEIHLVDLDAEALAQACARQPAAVRARLRRHAPVDLSGMLARLCAWRNRSPTLAQIEAAVPAAVEAIARRLPGPFDVVASCCLLTQMAWWAAEELGARHPMLADVEAALLLAHLGSLLALTRTGGTAFLATDVVTSETYPLDELEPGRDLGELLEDLLRAGNYLGASSPALAARLLRRHPSLADQAASVTRRGPWLWRAAAPDRTYLVAALEVARR